jgi:hypothetical protein
VGRLSQDLHAHVQALPQEHRAPARSLRETQQKEEVMAKQVTQVTVKEAQKLIEPASMT